MERIHVSVRARPLSTEDAKTSPWKISSDSIFNATHSSPPFVFDKIFREDCKTVQVYEARTKEIVSAAVCGFNGTVFAYGQTNSGKTHTMRGSPTEPGVIPLAVHDLFNAIYQDASREFLLRMSYLEIYNEEINDLLAPEHRKLQIHENLEKGIFVAGLREEIVASPQQVLEMMEFGESHRHIGETNMNTYSSRSHTIFRMIIESRQKMQDEGVGNACDAVRVSVLNLVDLAGSERVAKTGAEGVRLKEGSHINKSLMTLGTVIKKLSEGVENQGGHVPYRDSKLTRILQPALGGNANTAIICNITLALIHADETKSSLQFSSRALRVTNCAHVNEILTDAALLKRQKKEIEELRSKLKTSHSDHSEEEILNLRNTLLKSELERERIALELEEEKKAQAQREKVLQEQAKKIENLSTMVLLSNRDEKREHDQFKKGKRRDTWCASKLSGDSTSEVQSNILSRGPSLNSARSEREIGPLLPFSELVEDEPLRNTNEQDEVGINETLEESVLPDPCALVHVTSRRKPPIKPKSPVVVENELDKSRREYEDLLLKYQTERTINEIQTEFLKTKLAEATEQNICAMEKNAEIQKEINAAREEAQVARAQLASKDSEVTHVLNENLNFLVNVATEVEALVSEFEKSKAAVEAISSVFQLLSQEQCASLQTLLNQRAQEHEKSLMMLSEQHETERSDFLSYIECLEKDIAGLASSSLAKEKENLRKDFEKIKTKLKDTESKLKNSMQDKTKLEAEKAAAERELKRLHSQKALLERDISKQESFAGRRRDSLIVERSANQSLQEEFTKLERLAFEMEITIASLEENLEFERGEKEQALCRNEGLDSQITALTEKLEHSNAELKHLQQEVTELKTRLEGSSSDQQQLESKVKFLLEEKEELAMHLASSLLELEEEKAIWSSKQKALTNAIEEKVLEIESVSKQVSEAKKELESCRLEYATLADRLRCSEENAKQEKESSMENSSENDRLGNELRSANALIKQSDEDAAANNKEMAKLKMRLMGTQARLEAKCVRHKQAVEESEVMDKKFGEASAMLKEKLASKALEVINLKRQLSVMTEATKSKESVKS